MPGAAAGRHQGQYPTGFYAGAVECGLSWPSQVCCFYQWGFFRERAQTADLKAEGVGALASVHWELRAWRAEDGVSLVVSHPQVAPKRSSSYLMSSPEPGPVEFPAPGGAARYSESSLKKKRVY